MTGETATRSVKSFCRICTAICGIVVDVEGDQVVRVRGDKDHPLTHGYTCPKGRALPQVHHHPNRIEQPLMRVDGELQPATWEACLDDLGDRLRTIIERHGPSSVGVYFGSGLGMDAAGYRMMEALFGAIGTPAKFSPLTIDGTAKTLVSHLVGGFPGFTSHIDYDRAELVLYIGVNPVVSHGHNIALSDPVTAIRKLRGHAEVWVLDPRLTETGRLATRHLAPRPGTDYAVLAFLVRELLRDGADRPTLEHRTIGRDELAAAVEPFTIEYAADLAGLDRADLIALLDAVRTAGPVAIHTGTGVTMEAVHGNVTAWLSWVLMIITGAMNRPGGVWFHPGFNMQFESFELPVMPPDAIFGPGPRSRPDTQAFLGEWPGAVLADEINAGNIRAFLNFGGSLLTSFPDLNVLEPALRSLELLVATEIIANDTTAISSHVLPTKDQLERADVTLWDFLVPSVCAQHTPAVVAPVGGRRSAWWVLAEIGRRLGHDLADPNATDEEILAKTMAAARRSYEEVAATGFAEVPFELPAAWVEEYLDRSGGWRLAPQLLVDQLASLEPPASLVLVPRRQARKLNAALDFLGETAAVLLNPQDASDAGVVDGQDVVVRTDRGELVGTAKVDIGIRRGAVSIPHGHHAMNVNVLTDKDVIDPVTGMVRYSGVPVTLEPATLTDRKKEL
ncbi:MAG TPA: molybdopterin-dependent oxidoreductase [Acidimicrobiales bacterium]|jgi:anaerobic selenocysteine-containing dehydrogenase|nr:molybdopterin-dependent oxidoreductase [Acidimicrobiales bacterium]